MPQAAIPAFLDATRESLTQARLQALGRDLAALGIAEAAGDYSEAVIVMGQVEGRVKASIGFRFCPFIHHHDSPGRLIAIYYARVLGAVHAEPLQAQGGPGALVEKVSHEAVQDMARYLSLRYREHFADAQAAAKWLAGREPDAAAKEGFERFATRKTK